MDDRNGVFNEKLNKNKMLAIIDPANRNNRVTNNVHSKQYETIDLEFERAASS